MTELELLETEQLKDQVTELNLIVGALQSSNQLLDFRVNNLMKDQVKKANIIKEQQLEIERLKGLNEVPEQPVKK